MSELIKTRKIKLIPVADSSQHKTEIYKYIKEVASDLAEAGNKAIRIHIINKYEIEEINPVESLIVKIISGDVSDNINSVWSQTKGGKTRGIGAKGAKSIYDQYISEFGEVNLQDPDLYENIADLICEKKKLSKTQIEQIVENIKDNMKLIDLRLGNLPYEILSKMEEKYAQKQIQ